MDFWYFFLHRAIDLSTASSRIGFIVPVYWLKSSGASRLRERVFRESVIDDLVLFGKNKVFSRVGGSHMIFVLSRDRSGAHCNYRRAMCGVV